MIQFLKNGCYSALLLAGFVVLTGCPRNVDPSKIYTLQTNIDSLTIVALDPIIQKNDILYISFSIPGTAEEQKSVDIFNAQNFVGNNPNAGNLQSTLGYLVDPVGNINVPALGVIQAAGLTKQQLTDQLKKALRKYIQREPIVTLRIINFKISVDGELQRPGVYDIPNERVTLPEAIALAGGFSVFAKKEDVLIVRDDNGKKTITHIDLRKDELLTKKSEFYYLRQNDHIIVQANKEKILNSNQSTARNLSFAATGIGVLVAIINLLNNR
ncbi:MAG: polysaccharide biosynthesis/export family protein [Dinghuibacter sp.]|nr:polysaccharide biosynthesis/export family protein [Dinghuibacter sp.]